MAKTDDLTPEQRAALAAAKARVERSVTQLQAALDAVDGATSPEQRLLTIAPARKAYTEAFDADAAFKSLHIDLLGIAEREQGLDVSEGRALLTDSLAKNRAALQVELDRLEVLETKLRRVMTKLS